MVQRHDADDQAAGLRRLLGGGNALRTLGVFGPDAALNGVAAANLAFALGQRGGSLCLLDEATAPHNLAGQFGLSPRHELADVLLHGSSLDDVLARAVGDLHLLKAEDGFSLAAECDDRAWSRVGDDFARHDWAWLLLAAPAEEQPCLALSAGLRVLVLPAVKSRLTEAYAVLKAVHNKQPDARWLTLVINAGDLHKAEQLMSALNDTARQFLGIELEPLGIVPKDAQLDMATRAMRPVAEMSPACPAALSFRHMAERLQDQQRPGEQPDAKQFWQRMGLFSRLNRQYTRYPKRHAQHGRAYG